MNRAPRTASANLRHGQLQAAGEGVIRLLVFTSLYPNAEQPRHGIFVEERLRQLVASGRVTASVIAPVPWFPSAGRAFGRYAMYARIAMHEYRHGIRIEHPRYPVLPKLGMSIAPSLMVRALIPTLRRLLAAGNRFDLMDAHYFYPDGVAAARLGARFGLPVVVTARGSDVTVIPRYRRPRRQIVSAARQVAAIVTVSTALRQQLIGLGVDADKITVLRNGVDLACFAPDADRAGLRQAMGLTGPTWLTVGNLVELKGVHLVMAALAKVPQATLLVVGDGPQAPALRQLVDALGLRARVHFLGMLAHAKLADYYNVADALFLASSREGMPNVALESLACGTPVVAAPFAGVDEVVIAPDAGQIAASRSAEAMLAAWQQLLDRGVPREATRQCAEQLGWASVVDAQCVLYAQVRSERAGVPKQGTNS